VQSPTTGEIKLPVDVPPGTYDIALFDEGQELVRRPAALTVVAPEQPSVDVQVVGSLISIAEDTVNRIRVGAELGVPATGAAGMMPSKVLAVQPPRPFTQGVQVGGRVVATLRGPEELRMPIIVRLRCTVTGTSCAVGGTVLAPGAVIPLTVPTSGSAPETEVRLLIDEARPATARPVLRSTGTATIRVRFFAAAEVLDVVKVGDVDIGQATDMLDEDLAVLTAIGSDRQRTMAVMTTGPVQVEESVVAFTATLRVPVVALPTGWGYRRQAVKIGAPFVFETNAGVMTGSILAMTVTGMTPQAGG
jgi:hypothetical protein